jgi:hypothetical protein
MAAEWIYRDELAAFGYGFGHWPRGLAEEGAYLQNALRLHALDQPDERCDLCSGCEPIFGAKERNLRTILLALAVAHKPARQSIS